MKTFFSLVTSISVAVALASCGGGGDSPAATTTTTTTPTASATSTTTPTSVTPAANDATRYSGTWAVCHPGGTDSEGEILAINATSATTLAVTSTDTKFASLNCAGPAGATKTSTGTAAFVGTNIVGADTVDKVIYTQGTQTQKQILLVTATTLKVGRQQSDGGVLDADGYPTTFDTIPLTKQ